MSNLPVKVLQIGMTYNPGGVESYLLQQFYALDRTKVTYDFVNLTSEHDIVAQDELIAAGCKVFAIIRRRKHPFKNMYQWLKLLTNEKYDFIVLNAVNLEYVFPLVIAKCFGISGRIIHSHNSGFNHKIGFLRKLRINFNTMLLHRCATHYFACSEIAGKWMFGNKINFTVIRNAIKPDVFIFDKIKRKKVRQQLNIKNEFVIGHVSRFSYQKNHLFLIEIFSEFVKKRPDAILLLVGGDVGEGTIWKQCHELVSERGLKDKVLFLGARNDVPDLMQAMDCFVLPSFFEGLPLVGIEAQASGLPCYFSDTITREVGITELAHFISLQNKEAWVESFLYASNVKRVNRKEEIVRAGYDITNEIRKIQQFYLNKSQ